MSSRSAPPRVSIVTPSFNQGGFIEQTIRSVLDQGYENLEYLILDGGSTDGTRDVLDRYRDRLACCVSEPDGGQSDALINGFAHATGDIMGWLCADDVLLPGALETVARSCPEDGWLVGAAAVMDKAGRRGTQVSHARFRAGDVLHNSYLLTQVSVFWRASLYHRVRGIDRGLHYCMDWDLWTQFERLRAPRVIPDLLAAFRVHPAAKTTNNAAMWDEIWRVRQAHLKGHAVAHAWHRARWHARRYAGRLGLGAGVGHVYLPTA